MQYTAKAVYEHIAKKITDPIIEWHTCRVSGAEFAIFQSDINFYKKIILGIPGQAGESRRGLLPTVCPEERQRRRLLSRNERSLYKRKCDFSGKDIISIYAPDAKFPVYAPAIRRSDARDALSFGFDFDFSKTFTEQFLDLKNSVPMPARTAEEATMNASDYCNEAGECKNCYLTFETGFGENCYYCRGLVHCRDCVDSLNATGCERCYQVIESHTCHTCQYLFDCVDCFSCTACTGCVNCKHCIGCVNLVGKEYYINNKQEGKEAYEKALLQDFYQYNDTRPYIRNSEQVSSQSSFGTYLTNTKNAVLCFSCADSEDCRYCDGLLAGRANIGCYDVSHFGIGAQYCYECEDVGGNPGNAHHMLFSTQCRPGNDLLYCHHCVTGTNNCFGCIGLRNKSYCIFNKQYSKEEYEALVPKIIEHMQVSPSTSSGGCGYAERGEFFDPSLSSFGYNETVAQEYFPLTRDEAMARGYKRQDKEYPINVPEGIEKISGRDDRLRRPQGTENYYADDILSKAIICEISGKPFRIIKPELEFYRNYNIPLPSKHPNIRHAERMKKRPGRESHLSNCDKCNVEMVSVYPSIFVSPDKGRCPEDGGVGKHRVYCEDCYNKEIFG